MSGKVQQSTPTRITSETGRAPACMEAGTPGELPAPGGQPASTALSGRPNRRLGRRVVPKPLDPVVARP